ncbi:MAG: endonuclease III [Chitinispirillaceae bacterium]|nr:endonuclease III [Chitinispirillaceae bacterium]
MKNSVMEHYSSTINNVYRLLRKEFEKHRMPVVDLIDLQTNDPFKVLVATILSARTKDQTTAAAAQRLFAHAPSPEALERLSIGALEKLIFPVGFYHDKARHLRELPAVLRERFGGVIPRTVGELIELPGVGRKTANLVVAVAFNKPAVCVDIHVRRIFNRLGYLTTATPLATEMELRKHLPVKYWTTFNSYFVSFGQNRCKPVRPQCEGCPVRRYCARVGVEKSPL